MFLQGFPCDQAQPSSAAVASQSQSQPQPQPQPQPQSQALSQAQFHSHYLQSLPRASLFASPPASPPQLSSNNSFGNIFASCRNLQAALLAAAPLSSSPLLPATYSAASPVASPQLTPPLSHAPSPPPIKLRLRSRKAIVASSTANTDSPVQPIIARKRIVKRTPARGPNKRKREEDEEEMEKEPLATFAPVPSVTTALAPAPILAPATSTFQPAQLPFNLSDGPNISEVPGIPDAPHTPKRARIAPESLPLGLARSDFHNLHAGGIPDSASRFSKGDVEVETDGELWSTEEDRMLVELVLEKLQLSKTDWQDCARSLGKRDRHSVGRRWKSLMLSGDIGLRSGTRSTRRTRIHGTWR